MCGRYALITVGEDLARQLGLEDASVHAQARYNIAPTQTVPVVAQHRQQRCVRMRWGLVPPWQKGDKNLRGFINARAETLAVRRAFYKPLRRYRCLVPADGFYEWQRQGARRQAWFFFRRDRRPFVFAGIYTPGSGEERELDGTMAIVTCAPNPLVSPIHDRMPVILGDEARSVWLSAEDHPERLLALLRPFPAGEMDGHRVSDAVNSARREGAELARPLPQAELQFHK